MPILPGKTEAAKKYFETLKAKKWMQFCKSEEKTGVEKERDFLQVTPKGDLILMYLESKDISKVFATFAASKDSIDLYIKAELKKLTGIDFNQQSSDPLPELLLAYDK